MLATLLLLAEQGGEAAKQTGQPGSGLSLVILVLAGVAMFWLIVLRPRQQWKEQQERELLAAMKKHDKVLVLRCIYGQVVEVSDKENEVVVKLDETLKVKFTKEAISRNFSQEERLKEAQAAKAPPAAGEAKDKVTPKKEGTA